MKQLKKLLILTFVVLALIGCSKKADNSEEGKVEKTVNTLFKNIKHFDLEALREMYGDLDTKALSLDKEEMPGFYKYLEKTNKKLTYTIDAVNVIDNNATATIHCKYVDNTEFGTIFIKKMFAYTVERGLETEASEEEMMEIYEKSINDAKKEVKETFTEKDITLNLTKQEDSSWKFDEYSDEIGEILIGDMDKGMKNTFTDEDSDLSNEENAIVPSEDTNNAE